MAVVPIKATVPPSDVTGQQNGAMNEGLLTTLSGKARLHHLVARGWFALAAAAKQAGGWDLTWTSSADTYRTYAVQLSTFLARYESVTEIVFNVTPASRRKMWQAAPSLGYPSIYWIKKNIGTPTQPRYSATAAVPGTSPHGLGCAIDGALPNPAGSGPVVAWTAALPWLIANGRWFGFAWSLQSEPWHIQWVEGDRIPQAVLDFEKPPFPPPIPEPTPEPEDDVSENLIYFPGRNASGPGDDRWTVMREVGLELHGIDGEYADKMIEVYAPKAGEAILTEDLEVERFIERHRIVGEPPSSLHAKAKEIWVARQDR